LRVLFQNAEGRKEAFFAGKVAEITFGREQYQWHPDRKKGYAEPDGPPKSFVVDGEAAATYNLPAASVTVLRGRVH